MAVDWSRFEKSGYTLRRRPGGRNPLGDVKFMFPNKHSVYLHDTPQDHLFRRKHRTFSHGCVRVEKPVDLAEFVLREILMGSRAYWRRHVGGRFTDRFPPPRPQRFPAHRPIWTAWVDDAGRVQFRDDISTSIVQSAARRPPSLSVRSACRSARDRRVGGAGTNLSATGSFIPLLDGLTHAT